MVMYRCIQCKKTWGEGNPTIDGYSDGYCKDCVRERLIPFYRKKQLQEGNFDCFGRAFTFCDQLYCKYRDVCLKDKIDDSNDNNFCLNY